MASGKETPRQKMIGMMYLVLTALLALNVSKEILKGFVTVNESIENSKLNLDENNARVIAAFEEYVKQGNIEAKPYLLKIQQTKHYFSSMQTYIDSLKLLIVRKTEGEGITDTSQLRFMQKLDDYDTPTYILIGSEASSLIKSSYSAIELKTKLTDLHTKLNAVLDSMQKNQTTKIDAADLLALKQKLNAIKPNDSQRTEDGLKITWELQNFYHMPMAAVITNLNKIQADIKNVESDFLHVFANASSKFMFKIDKLRAEVIAPSAYVLAGDQFKANIVLGASSSELTGDRMKVLVDAEYDSVTKKITTTGKEITIKDGMGQFEMVSSSTGEKNLKGVIIYKNPRGIDEFYPFNYKYTVAPPYSAVAADNMNIFYIGVENPISLSSAGFAPADLKVNVKGCGAEIKTTGNGKYILTAKSTGSCEVTVLAKTTNGYKQQGAPKIFRVKSIPPPVLKVGGKLAISNLEFSKSEISAISILGAESPGFMFPVNMVVKSFDLEINTGGSLVPYTCSSNKLSNEAKLALSRMRVGQKAYIDNIKVQTPTGIIALPMTQLKVKS